MTKTLRVRERDGWTTKPVADLDENRLTAEEIDDNFLTLEDEISEAENWELGTTQTVTFDDPTADDITQTWTIGAATVATQVTEFGTAVGGEETITETFERAGTTIETLTTFETDGSITIVKAEVV